MTPEQFMANFGVIAEAPDGVTRLRELVVTLALRGRLSSCDPSDAETDLLATAMAEKMAAQASRRAQKPVKASCVSYFDVPSGWVWGRIDDIALGVQYGYTAKADHSITTTKFLRITDIQDGKVAWGSVPGCEITPKKREQLELKDGDLVIARTGGTIGKSFLISGVSVSAVFASYLIRVQPTAAVFPSYLYVFLRSPLYWTQLRAGAAGTGQPNVSATTLRGLSLPLPPLAEQKRIVAKVDQLMAMLDDLEQRQEKKRTVAIHVSKASLDSLVNAEDPDQLARAWERVSKNFGVVAMGQEGLAKLRETIGVLACTGKLSPKHKDDGGVEQILNAVQAERRASGKKAPERKPLADDEHVYPLPSGWRWIRVGELLLDSDAGKSPQCEKRPRVEGEYGVLKVSAVSWGAFRPGENKALPEDIEPFTACEVHPGDYLLSRANTGELVARSVVVSETPSRLLMSDKIVRLHFCSATERRFFSLYNNGPAARDYYLTHASGTSSSMKNVSRKVMLGLPVPLPPLEEQKRIVARVDQLMSRLDLLEQQLEAKQGLATKLASVI